jgi:hypothetical protein
MMQGFRRLPETKATPRRQQSSAYDSGILFHPRHDLWIGEFVTGLNIRAA